MITLDTQPSVRRTTGGPEWSVAQRIIVSVASAENYPEALEAIACDDRPLVLVSYGHDGVWMSCEKLREFARDLLTLCDTVERWNETRKELQT